MFLTHDFGVCHVLSPSSTDVELERIDAEQLGGLFDRTAHVGTDLVKALDTYLEAEPLGRSTLTD